MLVHLLLALDTALNANAANQATLRCRFSVPNVVGNPGGAGPRIDNLSYSEVITCITQLVISNDVGLSNKFENIYQVDPEDEINIEAQLFD